MVSDRFRASVRRHGLLPTVFRTLYGLARRVVEFEICRVEADTGQPYDWPDVEGYETRVVTGDQLHSRLCGELRHLDYRWAFARGSTCTASLCGDEIVGVTFSSTLPTRVNDAVEFEFPPDYVYSFASLTAPSHRGRRLEQDRWKVARRERIARTGKDPRAIWYVDVTNLESRATSKAVGTTNALIGYTAWARLGKRPLVFRSAGCRAAGAGFSVAHRAA